MAGIVPVAATKNGSRKPDPTGRSEVLHRTSERSSNDRQSREITIRKIEDQQAADARAAAQAREADAAAQAAEADRQRQAAEAAKESARGDCGGGVGDRAESVEDRNSKIDWSADGFAVCALFFENVNEWVSNEPWWGSTLVFRFCGHGAHLSRLRVKQCCARTRAHRFRMGEAQTNPAIWNAIAATG